MPRHLLCGFKLHTLLICLITVAAYMGWGSGSAYGQLSGAALRFPQKFHTDGNRIVDESGNAVAFKGVSALDPIAQATFTDDPSMAGTWNEAYYEKMAQWGVTLVRVPIHPQYWRESSASERFAILDKTIEWIGANGMYAILDFHSIGFLPTGQFEADYYSTSITEALDFWQTIAERYKDNNIVVFYEIFNEPVNLAHSDDEYNSATSSTDWAEWKNVAQSIIDVIRKYDESTLVLVGGLRWAYDLTQVPSNPIERANVVYGVHPYPGSYDYLSWEEAFGKTAEQYPVFASEFGFTDTETNNNILVEFPSLADDNDPDFGNPNYLEETYTRGFYRDDITDFLAGKNIGWTVWNFSPIWGPVLLRDWNFTPTTAGQFFMEQMTGN